MFEPGEVQNYGYGVTYFCPPNDSARSPSSFPPECRSGRRRKTTSEGADGGGAHQTLARSLLSSRRPVPLLLCCNFFFCQLCYPKSCSLFAIRVEISRGPLVRTKKTRCRLLQNWLIFCAFCVHLLLLLLVVGGVSILLLLLLLGFFAVFLCAHTHSFIVVILLVWFRLFAVSFRIDEVFRPCSLCGSQGLMTARGSRGRREWLLLLVGISGLGFS